MNIALVILHADPAKGGAERYTLDLACALAQRGHQPTLVASSFGQIPAQVPMIHLAAPGLSRLSQYNVFLDALDSHLDTTSYDIVHAMLPVRHCDIYHPHAGIAAESATNQRLLNRLNLKRRRFAQIERQLLTGPNPPLVLSLSRYIQDALLRHYVLAPDRLKILLNGVDLDKFGASRGGFSRRDPSHRATALIIAQDFERKGLAPAIAALAKVSDKRLHLRVVGRPDPSRYQRLADSLNVGDQVYFAGPTANPVSEYASADFFVLPTRHDPCSLVVLEALAMGLPVITTRQNGASEVMTPGMHGFVLEDADDLDGLAAAYRALLDPAKLAEMKHACLELRASLSHDQHVTRLIEIYGGVMRHPL